MIPSSSFSGGRPVWELGLWTQKIFKAYIIVRVVSLGAVELTELAQAIRGGIVRADLCASVRLGVAAGWENGVLCVEKGGDVGGGGPYCMVRRA